MNHTTSPTPGEALKTLRDIVRAFVAEQDEHQGIVSIDMYTSAVAALATTEATSTPSGERNALRSQWAEVDKEIGGKAAHVMAFDDGENAWVARAALAQRAGAPDEARDPNQVQTIRERLKSTKPADGGAA